MLVKDTIISVLKEKQHQLMKEYVNLMNIQEIFPELYNLCQYRMNKIDRICELVQREIYELEEKDGKQKD